MISERRLVTIPPGWGYGSKQIGNNNNNNNEKQILFFFTKKKNVKTKNVII